MRLTALRVCGTLLAFFSLFWTTADSEEEDFLGDYGFGPCAATLRPEGSCRQEQDGSTCPYLFSLPPLTFHLPKQLRELEKIVEDLQQLKDNVDQLRKMCTDCTVSQTERECGRQRERDHDDVNERTDQLKDERDWLNERNTERLKNVSQECGTDRVKTEKTTEREGDIDSEKREKLEEKERKKWDAERGSDKMVVKDNEKEVAEKDGKTQTEGAKGKDKSGQAPKVPTTSENKRIVDLDRKKVVDKYNRETESDMSKEKEGKGNSKANGEGILEKDTERTITSNKKDREKIEDRDHYVWGDETKETGKRTQPEEDRGSDGIKMSEGRNEHTNKEREQKREERRKEMEKGIKVEQNNEKPKQTESIQRAEKERTIKEGAVEEDGETGKEIKTGGEKTVQSLQRDGDGELESSKSTEGTDFVSISPTDSIISAAPRHDSMDLSEAITITSSLPSPPLSSSTPHLIADVDQGKKITADGLPTQSTGSRAGDIPEQPSPGAEAGFRSTNRPTTSATLSTLGGLEQQISTTTKSSTTSTTTSSTTTPHQNLHTTTPPGVPDQRRWAAKRNISSNPKTGVKPSPGQAPKHGERPKPEADPKLKNPRTDRKPDRAPLPDKSIKYDPKKKPTLQKPTTDQKSKTSKDPIKIQGKKSDQTHPPDNPLTDQTPKLDHGYTTDENQKPPQKPTIHPKSFLPVHRPTPNQRPKTENTTGSPKNPLTDRDHPNVEVQPDKNLLHPFLTDNTDQKQKPPKEPESEEKPEPDQRYTPKQSFSPDQEPEPERGETTYLTPNPNQKPLTEERPKPEQKTPKNNPNPKPGQASKPNPKHPKLGTGPKTKPNPRPRPDQTRLKTTQRGQIPNLDPKTLPEGSKTSPQRPPPRYRAPIRPIIKPGDTPAERPKAAVQPEPSPETATDSDPPQISGTFIEGIQNSQTDLPPPSDHEVSHPPGNTGIKPKNQNNMKTITIGPKTSNSLNTGPLPQFQIHPEGFTRSPNSRITSDLRPKTTSQPLSIQTTTRPNKIMHGIPPSVATTASPRSTNPNQASKTDPSQNAHHVQETAVRPTPDPDKPVVPAPTPTVQVTSTVTPGIRSTTPTTSGPEPPAAESSTPSARELRVKINQAAFLNNSLIPADRRPKEDNSRPDRTNSKQPTLKPPAVTVVRDCSDHLLRGETKSGVYLVTPDLRSRSFQVFCDMELEGGGWTLLQRRQDGSVSFNRTWAEYRSGFGKLDGGEFWLGNSMIHLLTRDRDMMLRVELEDFDGVMEFAEYKLFRVASERLRYRLTVGGYSGTAGDALRFSKTYDHNNRAFTTPDRDHDRYPSGNCGAYYSSGWWFDACMAANLNGRYYVGKYKGVRDGIFWGTWHNISSEYYPTNDRQSFKAVRMMIRPKGFAS